MMSEQQVPVSIAQHIISKLPAQEGIKPAEILRWLRNQFMEETLSIAWEFSSPRQFVGVKNKSRGCWPCTRFTENKIRNFLRVISCWIVVDIANEVGKCYGSTFSIVRDELQFRKMRAGWVDRRFTPDQKLNRLQVAKFRRRETHICKTLSPLSKPGCVISRLNQNKQARSRERRGNSD